LHDRTSRLARSTPEAIADPCLTSVSFDSFGVCAVRLVSLDLESSVLLSAMSGPHGQIGHKSKLRAMDSVRSSIVKEADGQASSMAVSEQSNSEIQMVPVRVKQ